MKVITGPTIEPVTLAEVKAQIGILPTNTDQDGLITRRIGQARAWAERYCHRAFMSQTLELRLHVFPTNIELPWPPVSAIVSVKYIDNDGVEQTMDAADYVFDDYDETPSIRVAFGESWPTTRGEPHAVRVQYTAGYGTAKSAVPDLLREAMLLLIGHWMNFQPQAENGLIMARVPFAIRDMLDSFKVERYDA